MCDNCFQNEIKSFKHQDEFDEFYRNLKLLIANGILITIRKSDGYFTKPKSKIFGIEFGSDSINEYYEYECSICLQKWKLSIPENAWRGFLLKSENYY